MRVQTIKKMRMTSIVVFFLALGVAVSMQAQQGQQQPPAEYYQLMGRANYAFGHAKNKTDYEEAVKLFQQAVNAAPWLADTYYDLGKAQQKAEQYNDAIGSLQRYLQLKPDANDRDKVNAEIEEIQGEAQQASEQPSAEQKEQQQQAALALTWTDPATGLMWARQDNGGDVNWYQARDYCRSLTLAGYSDWRLPTIDELQGIYDPAQSATVADQQVHIKEGIHLTGPWVSSSSPSDASGMVPYFGFDYLGDHAFHSRVIGVNGRALCVRGS